MSIVLLRRIERQVRQVCEKSWQSVHGDKEFHIFFVIVLPVIDEMRILPRNIHLICLLIAGCLSLMYDYQSISLTIISAGKSRRDPRTRHPKRSIPKRTQIRILRFVG
jgi:hypothetical protein